MEQNGKWSWKMEIVFKAINTFYGAKRKMIMKNEKKKYPCKLNV